ncbi:hypothetical protein LZZ85_06910 [Terrimonas sp. NA20]|uniref:Uncharacterized protein n=1 Tax=Terrimonas ginsenosidimutans TaxID=2908004 RepID=A0ABS9KNV0_9BACT|nr:hypothetical protein [Terrimonas ginsenosidimutans]MCG2614003.1 hypothetical protein [Terrimonas ginsenosidimutans]
MTKLLLSTLFFFKLSAACAQDNLKRTADPVFLPDSFYITFREHLPLFNGRLFIGYSPSTGGHPFYPKNNWVPAVIKYDGVWYNAQAMYDVCNKDLVVQHSDSTSPFIVLPERLEQFTLDHRNFVHLDQTTDPRLTPGFYEVVTEGAFTFIAKREKIIEEEIVDRTIEREFVVTDMFFVRKDNKFFRIKKKSDLLAIIKDKKTAILKSIREKQIDIRKNLEEAIIVAAGFYK